MPKGSLGGTSTEGMIKAWKILRPIEKGTKYGKWKVLSSVQWMYKRKGPKFLQCECICGTKAMVSRGNLVKGASTQCWTCARRVVGVKHEEKYRNTEILKGVKKHYRKGVSDVELGEKLNLSRGQVRYARKVLGLPPGLTRSERTTQNNLWRWAIHRAKKLTVIRELGVDIFEKQRRDNLNAKRRADYRAMRNRLLAESQPALPQSTVVQPSVPVPIQPSQPGTPSGLSR